MRNTEVRKRILKVAIRNGLAGGSTKQGSIEILKRAGLFDQIGGAVRNGVKALSNGSLARGGGAWNAITNPVGSMLSNRHLNAGARQQGVNVNAMSMAGRGMSALANPAGVLMDFTSLGSPVAKSTAPKPGGATSPGMQWRNFAGADRWVGSNIAGGRPATSPAPATTAPAVKLPQNPKLPPTVKLPQAPKAPEAPKPPQAFTTPKAITSLSPAGGQPKFNSNLPPGVNWSVDREAMRGIAKQGGVGTALGKGLKWLAGRAGSMADSRAGSAALGAGGVALGQATYNSLPTREQVGTTISNLGQAGQTKLVSVAENTLRKLQGKGPATSRQLHGPLASYAEFRNPRWPDQTPAAPAAPAAPAGDKPAPKPKPTPAPEPAGDKPAGDKPVEPPSCARATRSWRSVSRVTAPPKRRSMP